MILSPAGFQGFRATQWTQDWRHSGTSCKETILLVDFDDRVFDDLRDELAWSLTFSERAARTLFDDFIDTRQRLERAPMSGNPYLHGTRRLLLRRHRLMFVHAIRGDTLRVLAPDNARREPGWWAYRLDR